ncbi:hypothetical protein LT493_44435 [Streptomyces tricolor]|nr:hypothetical protein [Streptomyces tricolor]
MPIGSPWPWHPGAGPPSPTPARRRRCQCVSIDVPRRRRRARPGQSTRGTASGGRTTSPGDSTTSPASSRGLWEGSASEATVGCLWNDDLQGRLLRHERYGFAPALSGRGHTLADLGAYRAGR